ncbi:MAG TPA: hypothetical protein VFH56_15050 [Acidimicrobiales bacterium]|nr:hypothetical protein [Acidimicrobiales bacterium]
MPQPMTTTDPAALEEAPELTQGLTHDEDDELRRLNYIQQFGPLAAEKAERFIELRLRDRRERVRAPREFIEEERPVAARAFPRFLGRRRR